MQGGRLSLGHRVDEGLRICLFVLLMRFSLCNQTIENTQMFSQDYFAGGVRVIHVVNNMNIFTS
jgi:hypothetical protein